VDKEKVVQVTKQEMFAFKSHNGTRIVGALIWNGCDIVPEIWSAIMPDEDRVGIINILSPEELPYLQLELLEEGERRDEVQKSKKS
jgi:hypothetical protein